MNKKIGVGVVGAGVIVVLSIFMNQIDFSNLISTGGGESEQTVYTSEKEILEKLPLDESVFWNGKFYSAAFYATPDSMRLVDSEGNEYTPLAERDLTEDGELADGTDSGTADIDRSPVFCFDVPEVKLNTEQMEAERVVLYGLTYWENADGSVLYPADESYHLMSEKDGEFYDSPYGADDLLATENGEAFTEQWKQWFLDVRQNGTVILESDAIYYDFLLTYQVEYPNYFEIIANGEGDYTCYNWPVGTREVNLCERKDGAYEVIETRKYYLDADFLENTTSYDAALLKEKAGELSVDTSISAKEALGNVMMLDISSFEPMIDETVIYLVDEVPEELMALLTEMQEELSEG